MPDGHDTHHAAPAALHINFVAQHDEREVVWIAWTSLRTRMLPSAVEWPRMRDDHDRSVPGVVADAEAHISSQLRESITETPSVGHACIKNSSRHVSRLSNVFCAFTS